MNALPFPQTDVTPFVMYIFVAEVPYLSLENIFFPGLEKHRHCADACFSSSGFRMLLFEATMWIKNTC